MRTISKQLLLSSFSIILFSSAICQTKSARAFQIQFEALGPGSLLSINLDSRFFRRENGLGFRGGIGGSPLGTLGKSCNGGILLTVPLSINYLIGKKNNFLELGGGATVAMIGSTKLYCQDFESGFFSDETSSYTFLSAGYRYQLLNKNKTYRIFLSPLYQSGFATKLWGGISFGHRW